jgi:hypothetical protein
VCFHLPYGTFAAASTLPHEGPPKPRRLHKIAGSSPPLSWAWLLGGKSAEIRRHPAPISVFRFASLGLIIGAQLYGNLVCLGEVRLGDYAARWIAQRPGLRPRMVDLYSSLLQRYIAPQSRAVPLRTGLLG